MISVSNSDYRELITCLEEKIGEFSDNGDLREYNRYRRRKILLRKLNKKNEPRN